MNIRPIRRIFNPVALFDPVSADAVATSVMKSIGSDDSKSTKNDPRMYRAVIVCLSKLK